MIRRYALDFIVTDFFPQGFRAGRSERRVDFDAGAKLLAVALGIENKIVHADLAGRGVAASPIAIEQLETARSRDMNNVSVRSAAGCKLEKERRCCELGSFRPACGMYVQGIAARLPHALRVIPHDFLIFVMNFKRKPELRAGLQHSKLLIGWNSRKSNRVALAHRYLEGADTGIRQFIHLLGGLIWRERAIERDVAV